MFGVRKTAVRSKWRHCTLPFVERSELEGGGEHTEQGRKKWEKNGMLFAFERENVW